MYQVIQQLLPHRSLSGIKHKLKELKNSRSHRKGPKYPEYVNELKMIFAPEIQSVKTCSPSQSIGSFLDPMKAKHNMYPTMSSMPSMSSKSNIKENDKFQSHSTLGLIQQGNKRFKLDDEIASILAIAEYSLGK